MPTDTPRKVTTPRCDQCQILVINNVVCHETGCPNSWKGKTAECRWCGRDFPYGGPGKPAARGRASGATTDNRPGHNHRQRRTAMYVVVTGTLTGPQTIHGPFPCRHQATLWLQWRSAAEPAEVVKLADPARTTEEEWLPPRPGPSATAVTSSPPARSPIDTATLTWTPGRTET